MPKPRDNQPEWLRRILEQFEPGSPEAIRLANNLTQWLLGALSKGILEPGGSLLPASAGAPAAVEGLSPALMLSQLAGSTPSKKDIEEMKENPLTPSSVTATLEKLFGFPVTNQEIGARAGTPVPPTPSPFGPLGPFRLVRAQVRYRRVSRR